MSAAGRGLVLLWTLTAVACGGARDDPSTEEAAPTTEAAPLTQLDECAPPSGALAAGASLAAGAGEYAIVLVDSAGVRRVEGELTLFAMPDSLSTLSNSATPLGGVLDLDVEAVGAHRVGELDSDDPAAPGVLVLERDTNGGPSILLRLGSVANRRDQQPFDGGYTVLEVHELTDAGFGGRWRSAAQGPVARGFFCAARSGP